MVTKGYITKLPETGNNIFIVRIPLFETAGIGYVEEGVSSSNFEATLCYQPGNLHGYAVGDCVVVSFESDNVSHPIILGKLYLGTEDEKSLNLSCPNKLVVGGTSLLSKETYISDINVLKMIKDFNGRIKQLEDKVTELQRN